MLPEYMQARDVRAMVLKRTKGRQSTGEVIEGVRYPAFRLDLWAGVYYMLTLKEIDWLLRKTKVEKLPRTPRLFVCRQYMRALDGEVAQMMLKLDRKYERKHGEGIDANACFGRYVFDGHAKNWAIARDDGRLYTIEPATDGVRPLGKWDRNIWYMDA